MNKIKIILPFFALFAVFGGASHAFADTYILSDAGNCSVYQVNATAPEQCWDMSQTVTVNGSAPVNSTVLVDVSRGTQSLYPPSPATVNCSGSACYYKATTSGQLTTSSATIAAAGQQHSAASLNTPSSAGSQTIFITTSTNGITCPSGAWNCIIDNSYASIPITITNIPPTPVVTVSFS